MDPHKWPLLSEMTKRRRRHNQEKNHPLRIPTAFGGCVREELAVVYLPRRCSFVQTWTNSRRCKHRHVVHCLECVGGPDKRLHTTSRQMAASRLTKFLDFFRRTISLSVDTRENRIGAKSITLIENIQFAESRGVDDS